MDEIVTDSQLAQSVPMQQPDPIPQPGVASSHRAASDDFDHMGFDAPTVALMRDWIYTRELHGWQSYGTLLCPDNGRDSGRDAIEENADLVAYLRNWLREGAQVQTEYEMAARLLGRFVHLVSPP